MGAGFVTTVVLILIFILDNLLVGLFAVFTGFTSKTRPVLYTVFAALTPGVPPPRDPAVVSRFEAGLLARQAGVADEVGREDVRRSLHQGDVVVQLAVSWVTEVLMPVNSFHWENPLSRLRALQLVLPQDDPPAPGIFSFTSARRRTICFGGTHLCGPFQEAGLVKTLSLLILT